MDERPPADGDSGAGFDPPDIVLVGLMGAGKTSVGKRLAARLGRPFDDADRVIEAETGMTVSEIFAERGEPCFRALERRTIAGLLARAGRVLATGGGAFMDPETRALIARRAVSVWLKADLDVLARRVARRNTRPLLAAGDPRAILESLIEARYPVYALADITVTAADRPIDATVETVAAALRAHAAASAARAAQ